ncbi:MAG TPA: SAF domain-containing protein [Mycobacteriales bacterium]|jgi:Flp pilus assembly protein CpaB|nr:SAF domain-containing protein [Mycobacteriales bacterium]
MLRPTSSRTDFTSLRARTTDLLHVHRRTVSGGLAALGLVFAVSAARPHPPATTAVWVASHDLAGGGSLHASDVRLEQLPRADVPQHALSSSSSPAGQVLAAPVRRGEPLTDVRLLSAALIADGGPHEVAVPVRVTDGPAALALVKAGEHIAVIAAGDPGTGVAAKTHTVVEDVRVLALPAQLTEDDAGLVIVAATRREAAALAALPPGDRVSVAVQH